MNEQKNIKGLFYMQYLTGYTSSMSRTRNHIYKTWWHVIGAIMIILVPFIFFLIFSQVAHISKGVLFSDIFVSLGRIVISFILAAALGWVLAISFYRGRRSQIALPIFDVLQSLPTFAVLPTAILIWGPSEFTITFFLILTIIWPIFFSVTSSMKLIKNEWEEAVDISGIRGFKFIRYFLLPASIPGLITGSIVGIGEGWESLIATEIIVNAKTGLGSFFQSVTGNGQATMFGVLGVLLIIFSINKLVWLPLLEASHKTHDE